VLVDKVRYSALAPWPMAAASGSNSIQRLSLAAYGNEPTNWFVAAPSAGRINVQSGFLDTDGDDMDDHWETTFFLTLARDGTGDFDNDGMTDWEEYLAGTNPADPTDVLRLLSITCTNSVTLRFRALAGKTYTVQYCDSLGFDSWRKLVDVPAQSTGGVVAVTDALPAANARFYRIVTPANP